MSVPREIDEFGSIPSRQDRRKTTRLRSVPEPLPLTEAERSHFAPSDFVLDVTGAECLAGLSQAESVEYIELQRRGLDNEDAAFLRYILLGDRIAIARRSPYAF